MKIAVFHNYMDNIGGAEIVTLVLVRELKADLYTTNIDADKISKMGFADVLDRIFSIGSLPKKAPFRQQLAFWRFRKLKLAGKYNFFIISGDWAMSAAVNNQPNIWYAHSPLNELWEFHNYIRKNILSFWKVYPYDFWVWFNRKLTLKYAKSVNLWVCNSENTKNRIKKYYKQVAVVINPPVTTKDYTSKESGNYWLSVNRLVTHKRIDLQVEAFKNLPNEKLLIIGSYEKGVNQFESYKSYIEKIKPNNVEIIHWVDDKQLKDLYSKCKGFITSARDEDFGMTAVEAMSAGKPVIAPREGGYTETIIKTTGILIDDINSEKITKAVNSILNNLKSDCNFYKDACLKQAALFNTTIFISKIKKEIEKIVKFY
jgi:glycosyltransferase involved in cell wall biosynthesis